MTLLIDIGNVLVRFSFQKLIDTIAPGSDPALLNRVLALRDEFETGRMDIPTFTATAKQLMKFDGPDAVFQDAWRDIFTPVPEMLVKLPQWKAAGHRMILFSNTNPLHHPHVFKSYPEIFDHFDEAIMSYEIGDMKPGPGMYQHAIDVLKIDPQDTLYLDDLPENLAKGSEYGFDVVLVDWDKPKESLSTLATKGL